MDTDSVLSTAVVEDFLAMLRRFYDERGRHDMLWRAPSADGSFDPYRILVSELMLQQTQVVRVAPKFAAFMERFPEVGGLAAAALGEVLVLWSGLGYNRRAKFLHQAAHAVVTDYGGQFPRDIAGLVGLPGVGPNTAGAIMAYAYDAPVVYLETNIRTVLIHHFYKDLSAVAEAELRETLSYIIGAPLFHEYFTPREFYWAMMDYGAYLKKTVGNLNRASRSFVKQSSFHGSRRQVRGAVLRLLAEGPMPQAALVAQLADARAADVVGDLLAEGLIQRHDMLLSL